MADSFNLRPLGKLTGKPKEDARTLPLRIVARPNKAVRVAKRFHRPHPAQRRSLPHSRPKASSAAQGNTVTARSVVGEPSDLSYSSRSTCSLRRVFALDFQAPEIASFSLQAGGSRRCGESGSWRCGDRHGQLGGRLWHRRRDRPPQVAGVQQLGTSQPKST